MSIFQRKAPSQPTLPGYQPNWNDLIAEIAQLKAQIAALDADLTREVKRISRIERKVYRNNNDEPELGTSDGDPLRDLSWLKK